MIKIKKLIKTHQLFYGASDDRPQYVVDLKCLKSNHKPVSYWVEYYDGNTIYMFNGFDLLDLNRAADEERAQNIMFDIYNNHRSEFKNWVPISNGFMFMQTFHHKHKQIRNHRFAKQVLHFRRYLMHELSH